MADKEQLAILTRSVEAWNLWRRAHRTTLANLSGVNLQAKFLYDADLYKANLRDANLTYAHLLGADLRTADLQGARLGYADLLNANLSGANLRGAHLNLANCQNANFTGATMRQADLRGANLARAQLVETDLEDADLSGSVVYGISAWNVRLEGATQTNLRITPPEEPVITVDNLEMAQFLYLILHNQKLRDVIDTLTSKVVLILGRFTPERKRVLNALHEALRQRNYVPVLFDFDVPNDRNVRETVTLLARMARFVIADLTEPSSLPLELEAIVPGVPCPCDH
jgi:pentapeptide repeat protein